MATLYLLSQKRITEPELMHETVDINGKHATKDFEALFRDFTDEIKQRVQKYPLKAQKMRDFYKNQPVSSGLNVQIEKQRQKELRKQKVIKKYTCKKAVYENCKMVAPDG